MQFPSWAKFVIFPIILPTLILTSNLVRGPECGCLVLLLCHWGSDTEVYDKEVSTFGQKNHHKWEYGIAPSNYWTRAEHRIFIFYSTCSSIAEWFANIIFFFLNNNSCRKPDIFARCSIDETWVRNPSEFRCSIPQWNSFEFHQLQCNKVVPRIAWPLANNDFACGGREKLSFLNILQCIWLFCYSAEQARNLNS